MSQRRMRTDWRAVRVHPNASMLQTMTVISDARLGIALVVDGNDRLLGTVTDGDMRRAILRQAGLDSPVHSIMQSQFIFATPEMEERDILRLMRGHSIRQIPVCDGEKRVLGLHFLEEFLDPEARPNWAVIMAGGEGKRLWPLTAYVPKPMLPVGQRPILELILEHLVHHRFQHVFIAVNYMGDQIIRHFGDGERFGCSIRYLREAEPLGTGGALSLLPSRPEEPILVTNGDLLTDVDLSKLMEFHRSSGASATLCVRELTYRMPYGVVCCEGEDVKGLREKPAHREIINAGVYVLEPSLVARVPSDEAYPITNLIEAACGEGRKVKAFIIQEAWKDIGSLDEYQQAVSGGQPGMTPKDGESRDS